MSNSQRIYTNGGPVQVGGGLYIERQADRELLSQCREGNYCFVLSSRQVGKSSLMLNIARRLKAEAQTESVIVDLQRMGAHLTAEQWYQGFLTRAAHNLAPEINVADWWQAHGHLGYADRFTLFLQEELLARIKKRIVIFVDEIDTTLSLDFSDDFFGALRAIYHAREESPEFHRLSFVLIGVATPNDLIADPKRTPFNIGEFIELKDFTFEEARPLAAGFGLPEAEAGRVLQWVLKWTGGHPFLTQRLCRAVAEANQFSWTEGQLDRLVAETFFGIQSEQDSHLRAVRDLMTKRAPNGYEEALLKIYREVWRGRPVVDEERSIAKSHLKLAGVLERNSDGALRLRNPIYRQAFDEQWVKDHWPKHAWQRRVQRVALTALMAILVLNIPLGAYAWYQRGQAFYQREQALSRAGELADALEREQAAREDAQRQTQLATENEALATTQRRLAETSSRRAAMKAREAEAQRRQAERQTQLATESAARADQQAAEAREQQRKAEASRRFANRLTYVANMNLADKEFASRNYARGYALLSSYIPTPDAEEDHRGFYWYLLWKENHLEKQTLKGHSRIVDSLVWRSDGKTLASKSSDGTIKFWDAAGGRELRTVRWDLFGLFPGVWSSDGNILAVGINDTIELLDAASGRQLRILQGHSGSVRSMAWSSDGKTLASGTSDKTIKLWNVSTGRELRTLQGHSKDLFSLAWSSDGKTLASESLDGTIKLWDAASGRELRTLQSIAEPSVGERVKMYATSLQGVFRSLAETMAWSSDGKILAVARPDLKLWDVSSGRELRTLRGHSSSVNSLAWSSDGKTLASGSDDMTIKLWDVALHSGGLRVLKGHTDSVSSLEWSPDGKILASAGGPIFGPFGPDRDNTIKLWDAVSGQELRTLRGHARSVWEVAWSSDGKTLASGSSDNTIKLWDAASGQELRTLRGHSDDVFSLAWSPYGQILASGSADYAIKIWDATSGRELRTLWDNEKAVYSLAWSSDGKTLASGQGDTIKIWDAASGQKLRTFGGGSYLGYSSVFSLAWSSDGKTLASGCGDSTIKLWDVTSGKLLRTLRGHSHDVKSVAWSPDGKTLASASDDRTIKLWDVASSRELATLQQHSRPVHAVAWSRDGKTLASGSLDETIILRRAATEDEVWAHTPDALLPKRKLDSQPRAQR